MIDGGWHHQSGQLKSAAGAGLPRSITSGLIALPQAANNLLDVTNIFRRREVWRVQEAVDDHSMQDAHAEALPIGRMLGGNQLHFSLAVWSESSQRPLLVGRRVEAQRSLVAFDFNLFPQTACAIRTAPSSARK